MKEAICDMCSLGHEKRAGKSLVQLPRFGKIARAPSLGALATEYRNTIGEDVAKEKGLHARVKQTITLYLRFNRRAYWEAMETRNSSRYIIILLMLLVGTAMISLSGFVYTNLEQVVHGGLYNYGLQFNHEWAVKYWAYARLMLSLNDLSIATTIVSIMLTLTGSRAQMRAAQLVTSTRGSIQVSYTRLLSFLIFSVGVIALILSINYTLSVLAFIGLGLVFWGAILSYVRHEKYVKGTLLDKTILPSLVTLNEIIRQLGYEGKGIYLPPKYFKNFDSGKIYISAHQGTRLPSPEEIQSEEDRIFVENPAGILITSPGAELVGLFEQRLGTNFTKVDIQDFKKNIPRLLAEDLEIAEKVEVETEDSGIHMKIENSIYKNLCKEVHKLSSICSVAGCPFQSAIASALAKATSTPVTIEKCQTSEDGQTIDTEYHFLEEPEEKTEQ